MGGKGQTLLSGEGSLVPGLEKWAQPLRPPASSALLPREMSLCGEGAARWKTLQVG